MGTGKRSMLISAMERTESLRPYRVLFKQSTLYYRDLNMAIELIMIDFFMGAAFVS